MGGSFLSLVMPTSRTHMGRSFEEFKKRKRGARMNLDHHGHLECAVRPQARSRNPSGNREEQGPEWAPWIAWRGSW